MAQILMLQSISRPWRAGEVGRMFEAGRRYSDSPVLGVSLGPVDATVLSTLVSQGFAVNDTSTVTTAPRVDSVNEFVRGPNRLDPIIVDTPTNNTAGLLAQVNQFGYASLPRGTTEINAAITGTDNWAIDGAGKGRSILKIADGADCSAIANATQSGQGNSNIALRNFTIDGNKANQSNLAGAVTGDGPGTVFGVNLQITRGVEILNIEVHDFDGKGFFILGDGENGVYTEYASVCGIDSHHNALDGGHFGDGFRHVQYANCVSRYNGRHGWMLDHSESTVCGMEAYGNTKDGIFIRNVFAVTYGNLMANNNGRHGIHALGFTNGGGANWVAHNNGRLESGHDVLISGDATFGYGICDEIIVVGIDCGPVDTAGTHTWTGGFATATTEQYGLRVDNAVTGNVTILGVRARAGLAGDIYANTVGSTGNLTIVEHQVNTGNVHIRRGNLRMAGGHIEIVELSADPSAGAANTGRLYVKDNGAGKSELCVRFNSGAVQVIATEP